MLQAVASFPWSKAAPPPPPPGPNYIKIVLPITFETLMSILVCWVLPIVIYTFTTAHESDQSSGKRAAVTGKGDKVHMDIERRKEAEAADPVTKKGADRQLQALMWVYFLVPYMWAWQTQENPTVQEQVSTWLNQSWSQLTDHEVTLHFQAAFFALLIERLCYTWVHTFSPSFVRFCNTAIGRNMGKKPLDVVLTIFYINKCIQLGTFLTFYWYILGWTNPFAEGVLVRLAQCTRFQYVSLMHGIALGQGLNTAIYRAIGKAGVYYGYRLGEEVPWVTGFPFSVFPHPQYFGVCVCVMGVNIFCATTAHVQAGWLNLTMVQVLLYVYMALVEDYM